MYGQLLRKLTKEGIKQGEKIGKVDGGNPVNLDGVQLIIDSGKHLLEWLL